MAVVGRYLTTEEAEEYLGVSKRTLEAWRRLGKGPAYLKVSPKMVKYKREDIDYFMDSCRILTVDDEQQ